MSFFRCMFEIVCSVGILLDKREFRESLNITLIEIVKIKLAFHRQCYFRMLKLIICYVGLHRYRSKPDHGSRPCFGMNLLLDIPGTISVGDPVYIINNSDVAQ